MSRFSEILGSILTENTCIGFAIVENLYENLLLTWHCVSCEVDFSQNRSSRREFVSSEEVDIKNSGDHNSCWSEEDESNRHIEKTPKSSWIPSSMFTRKQVCPTVDKWDRKLALRVIRSAELALSSIKKSRLYIKYLSKFIEEMATLLLFWNGSNLFFDCIT
jgi:hypothetical protein